MLVRIKRMGNDSNKLVTFKSCGLFKKLIKSRSHSKVMLENKNQKERDRDETKNYYNTSV